MAFEDLNEAKRFLRSNGCTVIKENYGEIDPENYDEEDGESFADRLNVYCEFLDSEGTCVEEDGDPRNEHGRLSYRKALDLVRELKDDFMAGKLYGSFQYSPVDEETGKPNTLAISLSNSFETFHVSIDGGTGKMKSDLCELDDDYVPADDDDDLEESVNEDYKKDYDEYVALRDKRNKLGDVIDNNQVSSKKKYKLADNIACEVEYDYASDESDPRIFVTLSWTGKGNYSYGTKMERRLKISGSELTEDHLKTIRRKLIEIASAFMDDEDEYEELLNNSKEIVKQIKLDYSKRYKHRLDRLGKLGDTYDDLRWDVIAARHKGMSSYTEENTLNKGDRIRYKGKDGTIIGLVTDKDTGLEYYKIKLDANAKAKKILKKELNASDLIDFQDKYYER